ncbi:hypothetical protein [Corallococcus sp. 4LFB]|uniref:hypothetical protein n=1 Tax=Corallococcus sp. 4LFB TaxID=3383249 RepID=UPI003975DF87
MSRGAWWIAVLVGWLAVPAAGWACSCGFSSRSVGGELREARSEADFIYLGRIRQVGGASGALYTVEVLESFKGTVKTGTVFREPFSGEGDCSLPVSPGVWLIYAYGNPARTTQCSRSRPVVPDDSELTWLRTGVLPPVPVSLQRESVSCEVCDVDEIGGRLLVPPGAPPARRSPSWTKDVEARWKAGQPFFTDASAVSDSEHQVLLGLSREGRAFELSETPVWPFERMGCERRIQLRWCERLEFQQGSGFRCVGPGTAQDVCDERRSRKAKWLPMERLQPGACHWDRPDSALCILSEDRFPFPASSPALPVLACHDLKQGPGSGPYRCEVKVKPESITPEP